ncbi:Universal stress protein A [Penicillium concentricum]|uniref:Universal stress protein A n=1 Tax=Penicillium concentricum TaxID=293559 RepID=A0A9W9VKY1_9EURO|nr:Universal stress protein A [Penicillium concentricum]KAJ5383530.1 Universal stress protein A [Penicillium concentricum]
MSYHNRTSPEQLKILDGTISTTINEKPSGLSRTLQNLLIAPQPKSVGGTTYSPRGTRSPVEPLVSSPLRISSSDMASAPSSPERHTANREALPRRSSDQAVDTVRSTSRRLSINDGAKSDVASTSLEQPHVKKRFLQARDRSQSRKGVAAIMSGRLFPRSFSRGRDRDSSRGPSQRGSSVDAHSTPSPERGRPSSSGSHSVHVETLTPAPVNSGKSFVMHDTFNKSDEALAKPHGSLPDYIKPTAVEEGGERLAKDVFDRDKNMIESSEDEDTSSDEDSTLDGERGRKKKKHSDITSITPSDFEKSNNSKQSEEQKASENYSARQEKKPRKSALKAVVHPQTSFDIPTPRVQSVAGTPYGSEDEAEIGDIHRAQKLGISMSAIDNGVHNRSIRTIVRGNFSTPQDDGSRRRRRKYLIATDLSEESVYALEWTIGTVLRDGDTIFAIYAIHEDSTTTSAVQVGEGAKVMKDATAVVGTQTKEANQNYASRTILGRLGPGTASKTHSADSRASSIAEAERVRAVETVSQTCVNLLRKTVLQVRIAVEVIHCKNPKSMITEAIDELEPTLVIVGARGQSALKGVLLGSFSNYLLSNSSVPVMVARRRLKRHTWKEKLKGTANVRLSNNLITPKSLSQAKVD